MSQALLNHYIVLHVLKDRIDKLDNKEIAKEFIEKNEWYRNYFGQLYCIVGKFGGGKFGEFGELSTIHQTKTIQISTYS